MAIAAAIWFLAAATVSSRVPAAQLSTRWRFTGQPPHKLPQISQFGGATLIIRRTFSPTSAAIFAMPLATVSGGHLCL